jgi:hypothetical protein
MDIKMRITSEELTGDDLQQLTWDLSRTISQETSLEPSIAEGHSVPGAKGDAITIGTIILSFISSGAAVALFNVMKAYLERNQSLEFEFESKDGEKLKVNTHNIKPNQVDKTLGLLEQFMGNK